MKKLICLLLSFLIIFDIGCSKQIKRPISPLEELVELSEEEIEFCYNNTVADILLEKKGGHGIIALEPKLGTMITLAKDYKDYTDNAKLDLAVKDYIENTNIGKIPMLIFNIKDKTIDMISVDIPIDISVPKDDLIERHQKYLELYRHPKKYKDKAIKAKGNVYKEKDKYYLNLNYEGDIPEAFSIHFILKEGQIPPKEQDIISILGQFNYNEDEIYLYNSVVYKGEE
jgi:hypothetical protein